MADSVKGHTYQVLTDEMMSCSGWRPDKAGKALGLEMQCGVNTKQNPPPLCVRRYYTIDASDSLLWRRIMPSPHRPQTEMAVLNSREEVLLVGKAKYAVA